MIGYPEAKVSKSITVCALQNQSAAYLRLFARAINEDDEASGDL
jgi:hypothetical protein